MIKTISNTNYAENKMMGFFPDGKMGDIGVEYKLAGWSETTPDGKTKHYEYDADGNPVEQEYFVGEWLFDPDSGEFNPLKPLEFLDPKFYPLMIYGCNPPAPTEINFNLET